MTTNISKSTATEQSLTQSTISGSLTSRALFWPPRFVTGDSYTHHLPFSFWLTDVARPTRVMALGITDGQSYFGFCQALDKLNVAAMCTGYGIWGDRDQDSTQDVPDALVRHNKENYSDFSTLRWRAATAALKSVESQTLDLLVINLATDIGDADLFFDLAHRKMSDQGLIVVHGLSACHTDPVKMGCLEALRKTYATFQFGDQDDGVMVVLVGTEQDKRLVRFADMKTGTAEFNTVQAVFHQLGAGHYHAWSSEVEAHNAREARSVAEQFRAERDTIIKKYDTLRAAYDDNNKKIATEQAKLYDLKQQVSQKSQELVTLSETMTAQREALVEEHNVTTTRHAAERDRYEARLASLETQITDLEVQLSTRPANVGEIADKKALELQLQTRFQELAILQREILAVEKNANARIKAVKNSTSWRVTAPLRAVSLAFRRKKQ